MKQDTYQEGEYVYVDTDLMAGRYRPNRHCAVGRVVEVVTRITDATGQAVTLKNSVYKILVICDPFRRFATYSIQTRFADEISLCQPTDLAVWQSLEPGCPVPLPAKS